MPTCSTCGGSGSVLANGKPVTCPGCKGAGSVTTKGRPKWGRYCRTPEESFQAGWDDAADDKLSPAQITRLAALLRPHLHLLDDEGGEAA